MLTWTGPVESQDVKPHEGSDSKQREVVPSPVVPLGGGPGGVEDADMGRTIQRIIAELLAKNDKYFYKMPPPDNNIYKFRHEIVNNNQNNNIDHNQNNIDHNQNNIDHNQNNNIDHNQNNIDHNIEKNEEQSLRETSLPSTTRHMIRSPPRSETLHSSQPKMLHSSQPKVLHSSQPKVLHSSQPKVLHSSQPKVLHSSHSGTLNLPPYDQSLKPLPYKPKVSRHDRHRTRNEYNGYGGPQTVMASSSVGRTISHHDNSMEETSLRNRGRGGGEGGGGRNNKYYFDNFKNTLGSGMKSFASYVKVC